MVFPFKYARAKRYVHVDITHVLALALSLSVIFAASAADAGQKVTISSSDCKRLARSSPSANYKPGVDAYGNKVGDDDLSGRAKLKFDFTSYTV